MRFLFIFLASKRSACTGGWVRNTTDILRVLFCSGLFRFGSGVALISHTFCRLFFRPSSGARAQAAGFETLKISDMLFFCSGLFRFGSGGALIPHTFWA